MPLRTESAMGCAKPLYTSALVAASPNTWSYAKAVVPGPVPARDSVMRCWSYCHTDGLSARSRGRIRTTTRILSCADILSLVLCLFLSFSFLPFTSCNSSISSLTNTHTKKTQQKEAFTQKERKKTQVPIINSAVVISFVFACVAFFALAFVWLFLTLLLSLLEVFLFFLFFFPF